MSVEGGTTKRFETYRGWRTLLDEICWHVKNNRWDYPKHVYDSNGIVQLDEFMGDTGVLYDSILF